MWIIVDIRRTGYPGHDRLSTFRSIKLHVLFLEKGRLKLMAMRIVNLALQKTYKYMKP
jgi:hypothetical protein